MAGDGGTMSLRNAITCDPSIDKVVPSKLAERLDSALPAEYPELWPCALLSVCEAPPPKPMGPRATPPLPPTLL